MSSGMDGFEVCRHLKADKNLKEIPVIFLSAASDVESKVKGFEIGAIDFIQKPVHTGELTPPLAWWRWVGEQLFFEG